MNNINNNQAQQFQNIFNGKYDPIRIIPAPIFEFYKEIQKLLFTLKLTNGIYKILLI